MVWRRVARDPWQRLVTERPAQEADEFDDVQDLWPAPRTRPPGTLCALGRFDSQVAFSSALLLASEDLSSPHCIFLLNGEISS